MIPSKHIHVYIYDNMCAFIQYLTAAISILAINFVRVVCLQLVENKRMIDAEYTYIKYKIILNK